MTPLLDKFDFYQQQIEELRKVDLNHQRKLDEFEFVLHKTRHQSSGVEEINKKIFDMDSKQRKRNEEVEVRLHEMRMKASAFDEKLNEQVQVRHQFKLQVDKMRISTGKFYDDITRYKERMTQEAIDY